MTTSYRRRCGVREASLWISFAVCWLAVLCASTIGAESRICLFIQYGSSNAHNLGMVPDELRDLGWQGHYEKTLKKWLEWAPGAEVITHHALGSFCDPMELDSYDHATSAGLDYITHDFVKVWKPICQQRQVRPYVGNVSLHPRLTAIPRPELAKLLRRNLKPYEDAGAAGIFVDFTGAAHPQSVDAWALGVIDNTMRFRLKAGTEAIPERKASFKQLWHRDTIIKESLYQQRLSLPQFGHPREYITGRVYRELLLDSFPGPTEKERVDAMVKRAQAVVAEGHVPCVSPHLMIYYGFKPSDLLPR